MVSSGSDEAAQRADAVAVIAEKPFIVIDAVGTSVNVFNTEIAAAKIPSFSLNATVDETLEQAPYRWGQLDPDAGPLNGAEFIGKQLADKKAQYAGDPAMQDQTRKFGLVAADIVNVDLFNEALAKYGGKIAPGATITYPGTTATLGDPAVAQEQAPVAITKLKDAGVTSVILLADAGMTGGDDQAGDRAGVPPGVDLRRCLQHRPPAARTGHLRPSAVGARVRDLERPARVPGRRRHPPT